LTKSTAIIRVRATITLGGILVYNNVHTRFFDKVLINFPECRKDKSSLEPGKLADLVVLDKDILTCL